MRSHVSPGVKRRTLALGLVALGALLVAHTATAQSVSLGAPDPRERTLLRGLMERGAVIVTHDFAAGADARNTIYVHVRAPIAVVRHAIVTPEDYARFVPLLTSVQVRSRRGARAAFRLPVDTGVFRVEVDASLHEVSEHRVDFSMDDSALGAGRARWDLFDESPTSTVVALTVWADPGRGGWAVRQFTSSSRYAPSCASITAATVLALGVRRASETAAGVRIVPRASRAAAPPEPLRPLPNGPWLELLRTMSVNLAVLTLDASDALVQVTSAGAAAHPYEPFVRRLLTVEDWGHGWSWMRDTTVLARDDHSVRYALRLSEPLARADGVLRNTVDPGGRAVLMHGESGDFAGEDDRFDFVVEPGMTYVLFTSRVELSRAPWLQRSLLERDPWIAIGAMAYWQVVMVRTAFWGVP